jgi:RNA-directed DNA polymerase
VQDVIDELRRYAVGWMNYFGVSKTYRQVLELEDWIRRRVRLYYWKQWKRPRARMSVASQSAPLYGHF